jgi:preprotein translocase subunit YajC
MTQPGGASSGLVPIVWLGLILVAVYFLLIRPRLIKQRKHDALLKELKAGDKVGTTGGVVGIISAIDEKTGKITLKSIGVPQTKDDSLKIVDDDKIINGAIKDFTKIIGAIGGGFFLFSFFILGVGSIGFFGFSASISGGRLIQAAFDTGKPEAVLFGSILVLAVICVVASMWLYSRNRGGVASGLGVACLACLVLDTIFLAVKLESWSIMDYWGVGAWLSLLAATSLAVTPKLNKLLSSYLDN